MYDLYSMYGEETESNYYAYWAVHAITCCDVEHSPVVNVLHKLDSSDLSSLERRVNAYIFSGFFGSGASIDTYTAAILELKMSGHQAAMAFSLLSSRLRGWPEGMENIRKAMSKVPLAGEFTIRANNIEQMNPVRILSPKHFDHKSPLTYHDIHGDRGGKKGKGGTKWPRRAGKKILPKYSR